MGTLPGEVLDADEVHLNNRNISRLTPEIPFCPILVKLLLQENRGLTTIPPAFFEHMPALQVLDLSHTSIQSLPPSISKLSSLENFILRECSMLVELPPEIGALKNLKLFDLEGTEIMYLPKDIGRLENLECLRLSLCAYADDYQERKGVEYIIPRMTVSKLTKLKELSISVSPEAEWWEVELSEAIMEELLVLPDLKTLKLYLPTANALKQFLQLERDQVPIYSSLSNFRLVFGHSEELTSCLQLDVEENFQKLEKCLKYANSEGAPDEIAELMRNARALYLRRHWTIERLSVFDISSLKYCLLVECNEMQTLVRQEDLYENKNKATNRGQEIVLGSLEYLGIHFMKKLQRISSGPIGRNSLSCLRILALHTCPELTSVFTGSMLDNLQNLVELIVEDCPKVNSLVTLEATPWSNGPFLPNLRRILLLDLPELVSISSGASIAPQLDTLLIFNCMRLDYLSVMELPRGTKEIKGEIEWWDALKYGKLTWSNVFVQLERDGRLMDQLAEDSNSLQHFHELEINLPDPGSSLQVDKEISEDQNLERNYLSTELTKETEHVNKFQFDLNVPSFPSETQDMLIEEALFPALSTVAEYRRNEITEDEWSQCAGMALRGQKSPVPFSRMLHNEYNEHDFKDPDHKNASMKKNTNRSSIITSTHKVKVSMGSGLEGPTIDDGYRWRKYGQKDILGQKFPRSYFRCPARFSQGCMAMKQVQRCEDDPTTFEITYMGKHTCLGVSRTRDFSTAKESAAITWNSFEHTEHPQVLDPARITSRSNSTTKWTQHVKVSLKEGPEVLPDDGHIWRKYGEKDILGQRFPRKYYRCIYRKTEQCMAKKQVQRSNDDESVLEITYKGVHTCLRASITNNSSVSTESLTKMSSELASVVPVTDDSFVLANSLSMKSRSSSSITGKCVQVKMNLDKGNGVPPDDGYLWRKYGQKSILNCKYQRDFYRCNAGSCFARKQVQRSDSNPSVLEITYVDSHNCRGVSRTTDSSALTRSYPSIPTADDSSVATGSASTVTTIFDEPAGDAIQEQELKLDGDFWLEPFGLDPFCEI